MSVPMEKRSLWRLISNLFRTSTASTLGVSGAISATSLALTGAATTGNGSSSAAALATREANTGLYSRASGFANITAGGSIVADFSSGGAYIAAALAMAASSATGTTLIHMSPAGVNSLVFGGGAGGSGGATTRTEINKAITGIADNTATAVFTVTIPNAAHSASIRVKLHGSLGAGGAIGANESSQDATYNVDITRTAGVNAVATISAVGAQPAAASVAGAANAAVSGELSAISGAVGAANTFTINVKIAKSGGSSANHTCVAHAELLNANATGVTIA